MLSILCDLGCRLDLLRGRGATCLRASGLSGMLEATGVSVRVIGARRMSRGQKAHFEVSSVRLSPRDAFQAVDFSFDLRDTAVVGFSMR